MRANRTLAAILVAILVTASAAHAGSAAVSENGRVVITNLGSGTISVIDAGTYALVGTFPLPAMSDESAPQPAYVLSVARYGRVYVSDRANSRVVALDDRDFGVVGTVPTGAGVIPHMWADAQGRQLWVTNDLDDTITVIDPRTLTVIATVPVAADLAALGGSPHDVVVDSHGRFAYVSLLGVAGDHDYVVKYDMTSFQEVARAPVGKEPHLSLAKQQPWLYVPCQIDGHVQVLDLDTLDLHTILPIPRAHGIAMAHSGQRLYISSVPSYDPVPPNGALYTIDTGRNEVVGAPVDSPFPFPHNIALSHDGRLLFLTHSGATANKVTIYGLDRPEARPALVAEVTVGLNPFGLAYLP